MSKAYDSVSHQSLLAACGRCEFPPWFVRYLRALYSRSETILSCGGKESEPVRVTTGIKQGDPLSCVLFNVVVDWTLAGLNPHIGVDVAGGKLSAIAFADDVVLLARTPKGLAMQLAAYEEELAKMGLVVNAAKCASLHIRWGGGRGGQKWKCSSGSIFRARDGKEIPALTVCQTYKYLGVQIGAEGTRVLGWPTKYQYWCANLLRAPLKPEQRIYLLRTNIIPKLLHTLSLARATKGLLKRLDVTARATVHRALRLTKSSNAAIHATIKDGGLGFPRLSLLVPRRAAAVLNTRTRAPQWLHETDYFQRIIVHCNKARVFGGLPMTSRRAVSEATAAELHAETNGKGLRESNLVPACHRWVSGICQYGQVETFNGTLRRASMHSPRLLGRRGSTAGHGGTGLSGMSCAGNRSTYHTEVWENTRITDTTPRSR